MDIGSLLPFLMLSGMGSNNKSGGGMDLSQMMNLLSLMNGGNAAPPFSVNSQPKPDPRTDPNLNNLGSMLSPEMIKILMGLARR